MAKKLYFAPNFGLFHQNLDHQFFFFKNLAPSVTRYHGQISSCTMSEKTNVRILRKLSYGQKDQQTNEVDFIGHCGTDVEHPKKVILALT